MAKIPLRAKDGSVRAWTVVDDDDYDWLSGYCWSLSGKLPRQYAARGEHIPGGGTRSTRMHRQILGLTDPEIHGDHINGDTLDNRRANLRAVDRFANAQNRRKRQKFTSQYLGVHKRADGRWQARVRINSVIYNLGSWELEEDAAITAYEFRANNSPFAANAGVS